MKMKADKCRRRFTLSRMKAEEEMMMRFKKSALLLASLCFVLLSSGGDACLADQIYVNSSAAGGFEGKVVEESDDSFLIRVPKSEILRIERVDGPTQSFSSDIYIEEKGDSLVIILPKSRIKGSIGQPHQAGGYAEHAVFRSEREFEDFSVGKEYVDRQIAAQVRRASSAEVRGRILWNGNPLPNCEVKLSKLTEFSMADFRPFSKGEGDSARIEFLAKTDSEGRYFFDGLPPGSYRIAWRPAGHADFVRHLSPWSDIDLLPEDAVTYKDIEANVRTID